MQSDFRTKILRRKLDRIISKNRSTARRAKRILVCCERNCPLPPLANELRRSGIRLNVDIEMRRRGAYEARTRGNLAPEVLPTEKVRRLLR